MARKRIRHDNSVKQARKFKPNPLVIHYKQVDSIIEHLRDHYSLLSPERRVFQEAGILDEISLEGLSGINLSRLFLILDAKYSNLECACESVSQNIVWSIIVNKFINCKLNQKVRAYFVDPACSSSQDGSASQDIGSKRFFIDKPMNLPSQTIKQSPWIGQTLVPVQDGLIMGHCPNYSTRIDITEELIETYDKKGVEASLGFLDSKFGIDNVYFVANQVIRSSAILPVWADPNVDIKLREYCTLELIGKFRTLGIVFPKDKTLGRYRIMLLAKGFINQTQKTMSSPIEHTLKRFSDTRVTIEKTVVKEKTEEVLSDDEEGPEHSLNRLCLNPAMLRPDRSILSMIYDVILSSENGMTQLELRRKLHMPKFHIRNHLKNLISLKMISSKASKDPNNPSRFFKPAHKATRKKRMRRELIKPTGVMASWDETDLRAKRNIGHKRSSFSQAEDSLLILCRITSILIEPSLRLSWCVHKRLVRDILHRELIESHDKTSDACLRRIKYLKKLPNNIMSIDELTAELRDDSDILRLLRMSSPAGSEEKQNRLFTQVLKTVKAKIPNLLGLDHVPFMSVQAPGLSNSRRMTPRDCRNDVDLLRPSAATIHDLNSVSEIDSYEDFKSKYELSDCQTLASISRASTYEKAKNLVDIKFNNVCLVTMASTLSSSFTQDPDSKRVCQFLLDKFYSNYPDKMISSALSKLNKRSLLTRKCPAEQAQLYRPRSKMLLKLNQSVSFLLNRFRSNSLMQLAQSIDERFEINLGENNDMTSIALLTSLCAMTSFNLNLEVKIPTNVIGIDQGNENFKSLCEKACDNTKQILAKFMSRCGEDLDGFTPTPPSNHDDISNQSNGINSATNNSSTANKMDDSRRALFLLRHELKTHALDKCGSLSDCLIVHPCRVRFYSKAKLSPANEALESFLNDAKIVELPETDDSQKQQQQQQQQQPQPWLVRGFRLLDGSESLIMDQEQLETLRVAAIEFSARLWKSIDGRIQMSTLLKLIESLLSWIIVFPGIELKLLTKEFGHLVPDEHLIELLELMEHLELISESRFEIRGKRVRLFGYEDQTTSTKITTYEPTSNCYVRFCQLLDHYQ